MSDNTILIAYFSRAGQNYVSGSVRELAQGNAAVLAGFAAQATGANAFEIERAEPYPADYYACTDEAAAEKQADARPALARAIDPAQLASADTVVLIYPNWWGTMPMPVYTFLEENDFSGKTILPLCTHEGSGLSSTEHDIARICPDATVGRGLAIQGSKAPRSKAVVENWLSAQIN